ncbi:MAG: hypothetical protein ACT4PE_11540 [Candidatus Eiseniibacteriota bacterium]
MIRPFAPRLAVLLPCILLWSSCGDEPTDFTPNLEPNTRISAGPPEATDTGYTVNLFWFGWDDDGFIDHYEIAWETPDEWLTPIFTNDSLFIVQAADSCCVDPLPDFGTDYRDSIYEQFHTFFVRAVDNDGIEDPTPAVRSFNAKTIAPVTTIDFGPRSGGSWGTSVEFEWTGEDDDGVVVSYRRALATARQFVWDGQSPYTTQKFLRWIDTLTYVPIGPGQYKDSLIWEATPVDSVVYPEIPIFDDTGAQNLYVFAVRAVDDAGAEERIITVPENARIFSVQTNLNGPRIFLTSNTAGRWGSGSPADARGVIAGSGLRFRWRAVPGQSGAPVAGYSFAVEDTSEWSPFSLSSTEWPPQIPGDPEALWFPDKGPHAFFVRAIDLGGFVTALAARLEIFDGPQFCDETAQFLLVVLDTEVGSLEQSSVVPINYSIVERALIDYWFEGYSYQVFETRGQEEVAVSYQNCATSTVWLLSGAVNDADAAVINSYHQDPPNPLPSYVASGGNLFLVGVQPSQALRYFERVEEPVPSLQNYPVVFSITLTDTTYAPHWMATHFGIARVNESIGNTNTGGLASVRLARARSQVPEYPDLVFDPLTWPQGPSLRGFGYYDRDIVPMPNSGTEVIYTVNDTNLACGVRRLTTPGPNGNTVFVGLHPYWVERPAFRELVRAVLTQFGEVMTPP